MRIWGLSMLAVLSQVCSRALASRSGSANLEGLTRPVLGQQRHVRRSDQAVSQRDLDITGQHRNEPGMHSASPRDSYEWTHKCPQLGALVPEANEKLRNMEILLKSQDFFSESVRRMSEAVQHDTTVTDAYKAIPAEDPVWDSMYRFADFLNTTFPLVHSTLKLEKINTHGLLFTWQGTDATLKPTILMAHQDVVGVDPEDTAAWKYPPFEGHWDGRYVWGRGTTDCKNTLIASLEAVEELVRADFTPKRTVILSYGFDEEIDGHHGSQPIVEHLLEVYGKGGAAVVIDEGSGISQGWAKQGNAAFVGVAEKGYLDVEISVQMPSGHSSLPPQDNSITVLADVVHALHKNQYNISVNEENPVTLQIYCAGQHETGLQKEAVEIIQQADQGKIPFNDLASLMINFEPHVAGLFGTTQSIGSFQGGRKVNVVPATASVLINHRIIPGSSTADVKSHIAEIVGDYAQSNTPNGKEITVYSWDDNSYLVNQSITLRTRPGSIEPSHVSPYSVDGFTPYRVVQSTIFAQYGSNISYVTPSLMPANTDSRRFWPLTEHIMKFNPSKDVSDLTDEISASLHGPHSTDERVNMVGHVNAVQWYSLFLRNMDDSVLSNDN